MILFVLLLLFCSMRICLMRWQSLFAMERAVSFPPTAWIVMSAPIRCSLIYTRRIKRNAKVSSSVPMRNLFRLLTVMVCSSVSMISRHGVISLRLPFAAIAAAEDINSYRILFSFLCKPAETQSR